MAGLEKAIFPSGDVWMAAYIENKKEHFELRSADDSAAGYRIEWDSTKSIGSCISDFLYQDDEMARKVLMIADGFVRKARDQGIEDEVSFQKIRLQILALARSLPDINALYLPISAEMLRLITGDPAKINTRALKKIVDDLKVWRKRLTALTENVFAAEPDKNRAMLYMKKSGKGTKQFPSLRFGDLHMEMVRPDPIVSTGKRGELIFEVDLPETIGDGNFFVYNVLNTRSPEQLLHYVIDRYLQSQITMKPCKYCGRYFTVRGNYASEYCDRPIEGSTGTCKEMGAVKIYDRKKSEDPIDRAYKRSYKTHYARIKYGLMTKDEFTAWSIAAREKRSECRTGKITFEVYDEWLEQDKLKG